jgi:hypothetical protein
LPVNSIAKRPGISRLRNFINISVKANHGGESMCVL